MAFSLDSILRDNIKNAKPYSSARDEYKGTEGIFLDANENPYGSAIQKMVNRYPDPLQRDVKTALSALKNVSAEHIFFGNGSDEPIDLLIRATCQPGKDSILILPPTYGMYEVSAGINDVDIISVPLTKAFDLDVDAILAAVKTHTKIIFICSPNNPTGNLMSEDKVKRILNAFSGIVVVDEAYIDFADTKGFVPLLDQYPNMVVLQTFSKAWGMAALRLGTAFASKEIVSVLNKIKPPYNINLLTQEAALEALQNVSVKDEMVYKILKQRDWLREELSKLPVCLELYPSDANFILMRTADGKKVYDYLVEHIVITRDRSKIILCEGCVRITVGTEAENKRLLDVLKTY
ncbi:histidinol-phosphate transaminase [Cytophaga hutchinsonii]|uniref:Histidinol-phosphate aminotransferase n=1 Tax=Cytophaga hutchinsonii (strain ATCC 33406 / DSM 1761 / CIP 103989 / NBRC 15051 / NCIMB 9469 / D465) TaxID=269798 RepID=HIS8_CYTH3|nr:histidinol-phosphate transaminase [Cytophaga hutchinsonii]Q11VM5.1 RecName: Full=Histidinol-phosphate aminotransferase; AltName: Full=Imidazole acetol-phosphate transaminase [Cytophaga hutchinsonii ATCC 33406]ABG58541.1 histidinol phosphate aminotransferase apoenzyme [Cytophaga hutchinsonii ATCC 33406]SFX76589.1 histidinol-phosphate aminotransferase [Cytophaga hutchinsonii ATCC 33406]